MSSQLIRRIFTSIISIIFVCSVIFIMPSFYVYIFVLLLWIYAAFELIRPTVGGSYFKFFIFLICIFFFFGGELIKYLDLTWIALFIVIALNIILGIDFIFIRRRLRPNLIFTAAYINLWLSPLMLIYFIEVVNQPVLVWVYCLTVISHDLGGFVGGKIYGKNPLSPNISPNKTIEGLAFGYLLALFISLILYALMESSLQVILSMMTLCFVGALIGDLIMSAFKRIYEIKDFGTILPGHGGLLDRVDSWLGAAPFAYLLTQLN